MRISVPTCNGDAMYQNLLSSLNLTKAAKIFLEKDDDLIASGDGMDILVMEMEVLLMAIE